jgi:hypothetical protein
MFPSMLHIATPQIISVYEQQIVAFFSFLCGKCVHSVLTGLPSNTTSSVYISKRTQSVSVTTTNHSTM